MNADGVATEIPTSLKRLVRMVMRGFYAVEHVIVMDMLIRNPCMKEDDLVELLKFDRKQLRAVMAQMKQDRFVKVRLRMETGADGKATRQNYYYINYKVFVNVVKYKLDHMRRKIETEERDNTSRASFKCVSCQKTFTDLEADQLCDFTTGEFRCSYCNSPVEEDESALPKTDSRLLLARFNEQIEPLYNLLREVDDVKLAPELLEPEPTEIVLVKKDAGVKPRSYNQSHVSESSTWSGDATRNKNYLLAADQSVTINFGEDDVLEKAAAEYEKKEQPIWMLQSTIKRDFDEFGDFTSSQSQSSYNTPVLDYYSNSQNQDDIMEALLAHERKSGEPMPVIPGQGSNEESSSESEESNKPLQEENVEELDSDDDEEILMVQVSGQKVPVTDITEEHVAKMTASEKENYIRLTQDLYASMYE